MAARAIWKGLLRLEDLSVPVKLYSAIEDRTVRFHLLHAEDRVRVRQRMVNQESGRQVPPEEIRKGFEVEPGTFVVLQKEELEALQPEPSRDIEVTRFLDASRLDHRWYHRPYYLGPDGAASAYFALAEALGRRGLEGVARWVMRKKSYVGALRAQGDHLLLITLRHAGEVLDASELEPPSGRELDSRELKMAGQLIEALAEDHDPGEYRDTYRERVLELVETKARGGTVKPKRAAPRRAPERLEKALEASLQRAKSAREAKTSKTPKRAEPVKRDRKETARAAG